MAGHETGTEEGYVMDRLTIPMGVSSSSPVRCYNSGTSGGGGRMPMTERRQPTGTPTDPPLRRIRLEAGISQTELARRSGVARTRINEYETGGKDFANATLRTARRLADALDTTIDRLLPDNRDKGKD